MNRQGNLTIEKCELCGQSVDPGDVDTVQVHGDENGLCHASCLKEYDDDAQVEEKLRNDRRAS